MSKRKESDPEGLEKAVMDFVETVEATGGVIHYADDSYGPICDTDWLDLGLAYVRCCRALGRKPKINWDEDDLDE